MIESVTVGKMEIEAALKPIIEGDGAKQFFVEAANVLLRSPSYLTTLEDAALVGLDKDSVHAGFIAGLKTASGLINRNFWFLIEA